MQQCARLALGNHILSLGFAKCVSDKQKGENGPKKKSGQPQEEMRAPSGAANASNPPHGRGGGEGPFPPPRIAITQPPGPRSASVQPRMPRPLPNN